MSIKTIRGTRSFVLSNFSGYGFCTRSKVVKAIETFFSKSVPLYITNDVTAGTLI